MASIAEIIDEISSSLQSITVANGFEFDFGSVNSTSMAIESFPSADVSFSEEEAVGSGGLKQYGYSDLSVVIKIRCGLDTFEESQYKAIDAEFSKVLKAMKDKMQENNGALALSGHPVIEYKSFKKEPAKSGDAFVPAYFLTYWNVRYQN